MVNVSLSLTSLCVVIRKGVEEYKIRLCVEGARQQYHY